MAGLHYEVTFNSPQKRIRTDRVGAVIDNRDWSTVLGENIWIEPVHKTLMLAPIPLLESWSSEDQNGRLLIGDWQDGSGQAVVGNIMDWLRTSPMDVWVKLNKNEPIYTNATYHRNQSMFISYYVNNAGDERYIAVECGWGKSDVPNNTSLRIWSDGEVEVWRNSVLIQKGSINANKEGKDQSNGRNVQIFLIPSRIRELLIVSNTGGGFSVGFPELTGQNESENEIVPEAQFWVNSPEGQTSVQAAKLTFASEGWIASRKLIFRTAPESGSAPNYQTFETGIGATALSLNTPDASGSPSLIAPDTFTANGSSVECRLHLKLQGDGSSSPFIYGACVDYNPVLVDTEDAGVVATDYFTSFAIDYPDNQVTQVSGTLKNGSELADELGIENRFEYFSNRPCLIELVDNDDDLIRWPVFDGRLSAPAIVEGIDDTARKINVEIYDQFRQLENHLFRDSIALDGMRLDLAFTKILVSAGVDPAIIDIDPIDFYLPNAGGASEGKFNVLVEVGANAYEWLERLRQTYCATYIMGFFGTLDGIRFRLFEPNDESFTSECNVGLKLTDIALVLNYNESGFNHYPVALAEAPFRLCNKWIEDTLEPEANIIHVTGYDWHTGRPILIDFPDLISSNPSIPVSEQPINYIGEPRYYGWVDSTITNVEAGERSATYLYRRLNRTRWLAEFESQMLYRQSDDLPVDRGDVICVWGKGYYRVISWRVVGLLNHKEDAFKTRHPARYVCEFIADAPPMPDGPPQYFEEH